MSTNDCDEMMEVPEFDNDSGTSTVRINNGEWIDNSTKPIKSIRCDIDSSLVDHIKNIEHNVIQKMGGDNEFGGYVKWHWEDNHVKIDDIDIVEQEVTPVTVDFKGSRKPGYTGVFHRHPNSCLGFSGTDDQYINSNNDLSILFVRGTFYTGVINIKLPSGYRFQTTLTINIISNKTFDKIDVSMINKKQTFFRPQTTSEKSSISRGETAQYLFGAHKAPFKEVVQPDLIGFGFPGEDIPQPEDLDDDTIEIPF